MPEEVEEALETTDELWASRRAWSSRERKFTWVRLWLESAGWGKEVKGTYHCFLLFL